MAVKEKLGNTMYKYKAIFVILSILAQEEKKQNIKTSAEFTCIISHTAIRCEELRLVIVSISGN